MFFDSNSIWAILNVILIDLVLGGDNAVVIALACRRLTPEKRNKAIMLGTGLAVLLRVALTAMIITLLKLPFLLAAGGICLVWIAYKLMTDQDNESLSSINAPKGLFAAVRTIVVADLIMGFDNVIGIAGAAKGNMVMVIFGLTVSVPIIIWGSKMILAAMERFSGLIYISGAILAFTASGMITEEPGLGIIFTEHRMIKPIFCAILVLSLLLSAFLRNRNYKTA